MSTYTRAQGARSSDRALLLISFAFHQHAEQLAPPMTPDDRSVTFAAISLALLLLGPLLPALEHSLHPAGFLSPSCVLNGGLLVHSVMLALLLCNAAKLTLHLSSVAVNDVLSRPQYLLLEPPHVSLAVMLLVPAAAAAAQHKALVSARPRQQRPTTYGCIFRSTTYTSLLTHEPC